MLRVFYRLLLQPQEDQQREGVEHELNIILVTIKWILLLVLCLFALWSLSFITHEILYFLQVYQNGYPSAAVALESTNGTKHIVQSLLVGVLVFIVPRLLWNWYLTSGDFSLSNILDSIQRTRGSSKGGGANNKVKYNDILTDLEKWCGDNLSIPPSNINEGHRGKLSLFYTSLEQRESDYNVFVFGRLGKSLLVDELSTKDGDNSIKFHKSPQELHSIITHEVSALYQTIVAELCTRHYSASIRIRLIIVITHCDEVHPSDLKLPSEYDSEKESNIRKLVEYAKQTVAQIPHIHLQAVVPVSLLRVRSRDYTYNLSELKLEVLSSRYPLQEECRNTLPFAYNLLDDIVSIARIIETRSSSVATIKKYQLIIYTVSLISIELSSFNGGSNSRSDLLERQKQFWMSSSVGLRNITIFSLQSLTNHLVAAYPVTDILFSFSDLLNQLGHEAIRFFLIETSK